MGIFDRLIGKKEEGQVVHSRLANISDSVSRGFSRLRDDMSMQQKWVSYLHDSINDIRASHDNHRTLTSQEVSTVKSWINHIYKSQKKNEQDLEKLQDAVRKANDTHSSMYIELHKKISLLEAAEKQLRSELRDTVSLGIRQHMDTHVEPHLNARFDHIQKEHEKGLEKVSGDVRIVHDKIDKAYEKIDKAHEKIEKTTDRLSQAKPEIAQERQRIDTSYIPNPEQKLLNLLLSEADPVSYEQISQKTRNSINTVRVQMNNLKKRGLIEEHLLPSGVKLFNAKNKERIKKIYNIEHM